MRVAFKALCFIFCASLTFGCGDDGTESTSDGGTTPADGGTQASDASTGSCGTTVDIGALVADPSAHEGQSVQVDGTVRMDAPSCTTRACPGFDQCCNNCSAGLQLAASDTSAGIALKDQSCSGNECDVQDNCTLAPRRYRVCGTISGGEIQVTSTNPI